MKILFINSFEKPDYQNDMVYHGLVNTSGVFVYESAWPGYMLKGYENTNSLYGKGFTLYARMTHTPKYSPAWVIEEKIKYKFYDYVIYGSVHRDVSYLDLVIKTYDSKQIVFIDGEDEQEIARPDLLSKGLYFKRELLSETEAVTPINFSIPEEHVLTKVPEKSKLFAEATPRFKFDYAFETEQDYYAEYQRSYYGHTRKKAGFDCLRHYEILANGCLPIFEDLDKVPATTMTMFPKDILKLVAYNVNKLPKPLANYEELTQSMLEYTKQNLTTIKEAKRLLEIISK